jgi:hypothetical protein
MGGLLGMLMGSAPGAAPGAEFAQRAMQDQGNLGRGQMGWNSGFNKKSVFDELLKAIAARQAGMAQRAQQAANVPFRKG